MFRISEAKEAIKREDEGVVLPFKNLDGSVVEGTSVTVAGSYSETYKKNIKALRKENQEKGHSPDEDELSAYLPACSIKSWEGFQDDEGKNFPHTMENAVALMMACPWFADEVRAKAFDHAGFFPKPSANS